MERDDLILDHSYSVAANHDEEHGKLLRKTIWKVTAILSIITLVEVGLGMAIKQDNAFWPVVKYSFLFMTLVKAGYIVLVFMHLGDEKKSFKWMLFGPYFIFMGYLIFQLITEGGYQGELLHEASGQTKTEMPVKEAADSHSEH
jgi:cytochrome c oxidase subunit IV